jgi:hypothetical protein
MLAFQLTYACDLYILSCLSKFLYRLLTEVACSIMLELLISSSKSQLL